MPRRAKKKQSGSEVLLRGIISAVIFLVIYFVVSLILGAAVFLLNKAQLIGPTTYNFLFTTVSLLSLSISVLIYLYGYKGIKMRQMPSSLGLSLKGFTLKNISIGIFIFLIILALELLVSLIGSLTNVQINTNVAMVFAGAPLWFYIFAALIEPINEEIMFRGFLLPRIGIIMSSVIFGLAHYSYDSTFGIEIIAALIFGLIAAYAAKKTGSIYPGIVAHILVNSLAVIGLLG